MNTFKIPVTEIKYEGTSVVSNHVLVQPDGKRHGIGGVPRGHSGRQEYQGELIPGPWAYAFGLGTCIAANPEHGTWGEVRRNRAAGIEHDVVEGDRIEFDGVLYEIVFTDGFGQQHGRREFIKLIPIEGRAALDYARRLGQWFKAFESRDGVFAFTATHAASISARLPHSTIVETPHGFEIVSETGAKFGPAGWVSIETALELLGIERPDDEGVPESPEESARRRFAANDECPQCSRIGQGPLCKAHATAPLKGYGYTIGDQAHRPARKAAKSSKKGGRS